MSTRLKQVLFVVWLGGVLAWCAGWVLAARFTVAGSVALQDLRVFRFATDLALRHGWTAVYDASRYVPAARAVFGPSIQPLYEPPTMAPIWEPLQAIPWPAAGWLWLAAGLGLVAASALLLTWELAPSRRLALAAAFLAFYPAWFAVTQGQVTPLVLVGLAGAYRLLPAERPWLAGIALAATVLKPHTAFLVPVALLAAGRWRPVVTAGLAAAAWTGVSVAVVGPAAVRDWASELLRRPFHGTDQSNTLAYYLHGAPTEALIVVAAAVVAVVAWRFRSRRGGLEVAVAIGLIGSLLATPYANPQDFSGLAVAAVLLWRAFPRPWVAVMLGALYFLLNPFGWFVVPSPVVILEVAALVGLVVLAWQAPPSAHADTSPSSGEETGPQTIPSSQRASSVMRSGVQGGS